MLDLRTAESNWRQASAKITGVASAADEGRKIFVTPFPGAFGIAGYVLTVDGVPPRTLTVFEISEQSITVITSSRNIRIEMGSQAASAHQKGIKQAFSMATLRLLEALRLPTRAGAEYEAKVVAICEGRIVKVDGENNS